MFRLARIARSAPLAVRMAIVVPRAPAIPAYAPTALAPGVRYNSSARSAAAEQPKLSRQERRARYADLHTALRDHQAPVITYEQLKPKTDAPDPNEYLIDVREPDEVVQGAIPSAVNLPLSELPGALNLPSDTFQSKYGYAKPRKDQQITFYCRSGKRSASAGDVAFRNGFTNVLNYEGSWLDWVSRTKQP